MKAEQTPPVKANVFLLGLVSLFTDVSSEMIFPVLPLFLRTVLNTPFTVIGLIEGAAESIASLLRVLAGWLSDRTGKRKPLAVLGYGLSTAAKPFMCLAGSWGVAFGVRFADRVGKGIRTAPRDALIADSLSPEQRGRGFGIHRSMDTLGAVLGILAAVAIVFMLQGDDWAISAATYRRLVLFGTIPAVLALLVFPFVKETPRAAAIPGHAGQRRVLSGIDRRFLVFLAIVFLFTLGNSSDAFLILRAHDLGHSVLEVLLMLVLFNGVYAALSTPAGTLSDRLGRKRVIAAGWLVYAAVYLGFALAHREAPWLPWLLFGLYGFHYALAEGAARALVADLVPVEKRGTAYGLFHGVLGATLLPASLIAGWLWQSVGPSAPFYFGAATAASSAAALWILVRR